MQPTELRAVYKPGAGWQIEGFIPDTVDCVEFVLKADYQPLCQMHDRILEGNVKLLFGYGPWIQFEPEEWREMIGLVFTEMVRLWNEKHAPHNHLLQADVVANCKEFDCESHNGIHCTNMGECPKGLRG